MKEDTVSMLQCLECEGVEFQIHQEQCDAREIRKGILVCKTCETNYQIKEGILSFLPCGPEYEAKEQKKEQYFQSIVDDEWLLSLPMPLIDCLYSSFEKKGGGKALNFFDMFQKLAISGKERVLELAAGTCWVSNEFAKRGCYCVAGDISKAKYTGLRSADVYIENNGVFFERFLLGFGKLPFKSNVFDIVFIQSGLQFATNLGLTLKEIARVLRPQGRLVLLYTGTHGLFRYSTQKWGPGFSLPKYLKYIKREGLRPTLYFPSTVRKRLEEGVKAGIRFYTLARIFSFIWNNSVTIKKLCLRFGSYPMTLLFGVPINMIALKQNNFRD